MEAGWGVEAGWVGMVTTIVVSYLVFWEEGGKVRCDGLLDGILCGTKTIGVFC